MKFVRFFGFSISGGSSPFSRARAKARIIYAIFLPNMRMICKPSSSLRTSSGVFPCTIGQYWLGAIGMPQMVKYLES